MRKSKKKWTQTQRSLNQHTQLLSSIVSHYLSSKSIISVPDEHSVPGRSAHLYELVQGGVGGVVGDEEPHVLVGDLHRGRSVHTSHCDNVKKSTNDNNNDNKETEKSSTE